MGLEPTRHCCHRHLKPARLPIPPLLHNSYHACLSDSQDILYLVCMKKSIPNLFNIVVFWCFSTFFSANPMKKVEMSDII